MNTSVFYSIFQHIFLHLNNFQSLTLKIFSQKDQD